ncbi:hypothetical protein NC651_028024 [Populus alba x Populus x berolinensis]|nr:hypothetical protein NC651_028024 [Populus alba x Populus x berolinensis]
MFEILADIKRSVKDLQKQPICKISNVLNSNIVSKNEGHIQIANHSDRKHLNDSKDQDILWLLNKWLDYSTDMHYWNKFFDKVRPWIKCDCAIDRVA